MSVIKGLKHSEHLHVQVTEDVKIPDYGRCKGGGCYDLTVSREFFNPFLYTTGHFSSFCNFFLPVLGLLLLTQVGATRGVQKIQSKSLMVLFHTIPSGGEDRTGVYKAYTL